MADETPPEKPKVIRSAVSGVKPSEALAQMLGGMQLPTYKEVSEAFYRTPTANSRQEELQPAAIGGEEKKRKPRGRQGKVTTRGRHRVMNHWEIFDSELNELSGLQQDTIRSFTLAAFFGALGLDIARDLASSQMTATQFAFWGALAIACIVLAVWNWSNGRHAKNRGATRLQQIKDEHDEQ